MDETSQNTLPPYKFIILDNNGEPKHVFVFNYKNEDIDLNNDIFNEQEKNYLERFNTPIHTSLQYINKDDTIKTIKRKLLKQFDFQGFSYEEIYLFSSIDFKVNFQKHFHYLKNENSGITKLQLGQLIMNLKILDNETRTKNLGELDKAFYLYKDIEQELKLHNTTKQIDIPIGHKFENVTDLLFSANPFHCLPNNESAYQDNPNNILHTFENSLLLSYKKLKNNTIFVCLARDVLEYMNTRGINEKNTISRYYPFLYNKNVFSLSMLKKESIKLIENSKKTLNKISDTQIDTLYSIYSKNDIVVPYIQQGIKLVSVTLYPEIKLQLPLDNIFKQLHSTQERPFIKYKPGFKKEELYRLYSSGYANNGTKVPYLSKSLISNFNKHPHNSIKYILIVVEKKIKDKPFHLFYNISQNGNINIHITFPILVDKKMVETIVADTINPIIIDINFFLQANNKISLFENLDSHLLETNKLNYVSTISSNKSLKTTDMKMLNSVFNIIELDTNKTSLKYKRVENYIEMNEMNAQINQMYKQNVNIKTIVELISVNFGISEEEANENIVKYLNECTRINGTFINKNVDIADNPGFSTVLTNYDIENYIEFEIFDINSFHYLDSIKIYIDSFIKLSQFKKDLNIKDTEIDKLKKEESKAKREPETQNLVITQQINDVSDKPLDILEEQDDNDGIFFDDEGDEDEEYVSDEEKEDTPEENFEKNTVLLDDDDEDEDDDGGLLMGGVKTDKGAGNIFYNKLKRLEPTIFIQATDGAFAKICPAQSNRQPVILTQEEKDLIDQDENAKNAYGISIKYGSDPNKPYWYMCPRYWCLSTNKPMTEEQVKNGECGGKIIPSSQKNKIPEGHYIYEFTDDRQHKDSEGNYIHYNPGFLDKSKSNNNTGVPCCFKNPFGAKQNQRRNELNIKDEDISQGNSKLIYGEKVDKNIITRNYSNILSIERTPIPQNRWGFIPLSVELFLQINNSITLDPTNDTYIKKNETPLLRYGVEKSNKQSFIACIADLYTFHNNIDVPSIKEMKKIISKNISLDIYRTLQNGNLTSLFQPKKVNVSDIEVEKFKNTDLYKSTDLNEPAQYNTLKFTISSYKNFINFLNDDDSIIDHVFLWDIVSSPNTNLFENGLNIVIMEVEDNDKRDNITLLCPTNAYSDLLFDSNKGTVLILKNKEYYEPIYIYGSTKTDKSSTKTGAIKIFYRDNTPSKLTPIFNNIKNTMNKYCKPNNKNKIYTYKENISLQQLYNELETINFAIHKQIKNYRNRIIGLIVSQIDETKHIFLPCKPSTELENLPIEFIDNVEWLSYTETVTNLKMINSRTNGKILCNPIAKLEEDGLIVGIITETNQFISISEPQQNLMEDGIKTIKTTSYSNYYDIDKALTTSTKIDEERELVTRNIHLETKFYLQFRHKLKDELNNLMNSVDADQLEYISKSKDLIYEIKLKKIKTLLQKLLLNSVNFVDFDEETLKLLYSKNTMEFNNKHGLCLHNDNMLCIPENNLITNEPNEIIYFVRLSDEIIRNNRIKNYLFNPFYTKLMNVDYSIEDDEMLLLNSHLTEEFYETSLQNENKYVQNIPFEYATSNTNKNTRKTLSIDEQISTEVFFKYSSFSKECKKEERSVTKKTNWNNIFNKDHKEMVLHNSPVCSFFPLIYSMKTIQNKEENLLFIKKTLVTAYNKLFENVFFKNVVYNILSKQTKRLFISKITKNSITFDTMIMNDSYTITHFDLWVFCNHLNLPVVLYSDQKYATMQLESNYLILGGDPTVDEYVFVYSKPLKPRDSTPSSFTIIEAKMKINNIDNVTFIKQDLEKYLLSYKLDLKIKI